MAPAREVTLVASGMAFALAGEPEMLNPPLTFRPGERVRLVLKNEASGLRHDLAIPAWNVAVDAVATGETAQVTFTVPPSGREAEYLCRPHAAMMRGPVNVADAR